MEMLRSLLSWMHWRRRARERLTQQVALAVWMQVQLPLAEAFQDQKDSNRRLLLEALTPLAQALQRLDSRQQESNQDQVMLLAEHREMLVEVLQSLQPSVQEQIFQPTGQPVSTRYYPSSVS